MSRRELVGRSREQQLALSSLLYTESSIFDEEQRQIFESAWQYVGATHRVEAAGSFFTTKIGRVPIIVLRDESMRLRAFVNICPHRGSELVLAASGQRKTLQCHYHAWTFSLEGRLKAAPCSREQACFDASLYSLQELPVDTLGPLIFVRPTPGESLSSFLGELPTILREAGADLSVLHPRGGTFYETAANWKIIVENYLECYHCAVAHPRFSQSVDLNQYEVIPYQNFSLQRGPIKANARELRASEGLLDSLYFYIWPNLMLNFYPGPGSLSLNLIQPKNTGSSLALYEFFFADAVTQDDTGPFIQLIDEVQREDVALCESVQRGMSSGRYSPGPLMMSRESGLSHFHSLYDR